MNPTKAIETLIRKGYLQNEIAEAVRSSTPTISRIKGGNIKVEWKLGNALINLAKTAKKRNGARRAKEAR